MVRTVGTQPTLWGSVSPEPLVRLPAELAAVDPLFDDVPSFEPYQAVPPCDVGAAIGPDRRSLPLMFLKHRYRRGSNRCDGRWRTRSAGHDPVVSRWVTGCIRRR